MTCIDEMKRCKHYIEWKLVTKIFLNWKERWYALFVLVSISISLWHECENCVWRREERERKRKFRHDMIFYAISLRFESFCDNGEGKLGKINRKFDDSRGTRVYCAALDVENDDNENLTTPAEMLLKTF